LTDPKPGGEGRGVPAFGDLRAIRHLMGKSQSQMARLMGVSTRAVQSYEQGWRGAPPTVQKHAMLLLYLHRRRAGTPARPCWEVCQCGEAERRECPAYLLGEGQLCWLATGNRLPGMKGRATWAAKAARCRECPAMAERLGL